MALVRISFDCSTVNMRSSESGPNSKHAFSWVLSSMVGMLHDNRVCQTYPNLNEAKVSEMAGQIDLFFVTRFLAKV